MSENLRSGNISRQKSLRTMARPSNETLGVRDIPSKIPIGQKKERFPCKESPASPSPFVIPEMQRLGSRMSQICLEGGTMVGIITTSLEEKKWTRWDLRGTASRRRSLGRGPRISRCGRGRTPRRRPACPPGGSPNRTARPTQPQAGRGRRRGLRGATGGGAALGA